MIDACRVDGLTSTIKEVESITTMSSGSTQKELHDIVEELVYIRLHISMGDE